MPPVNASRCLLDRLALAASLAGLVVAPSSVEARDLTHFPSPEEPTPALSYAELDGGTCLSELSRRGVAFTRVEEAPGVRTPVRLAGPVRGVLYRTDLPTEQRRSVPWEVYDCRIVLALDDFSRILRAHDVVEVRIFSAWRPPPRSWPKGRIGIRHPGGMAVDLREFRKVDGDVLNVQDHYNGRIGAPSCGPNAPAPAPRTTRARELRSITCEAADARIFNSILTPNHDRPHFNHLHVEVRADVSWYILR